jgi:5-methylcytosine-specific restriction endonuclease McrA
MLVIIEKPISKDSSALIQSMQALIDAETAYEGKIIKANRLWRGKTNTNAGKQAFRDIRDTLSDMCIGPIRCAYCEDSMADEIEHIYPKTLFPEKTFLWSNYLFACGPCNGPKRAKYGYLNGDQLEEFVRRRKGPILPPPPGQAALIDPRSEDPTSFLDLDLGGVTQDGMSLDPTFEFVPSWGLNRIDASRAEFTIRTLGLNREVLRAARKNAFGGFRARLKEFVSEKKKNERQARLDELRDDILHSPHLSVFFEMRRQRRFLPEVDALFVDAPEILCW